MGLGAWSSTGSPEQVLEAREQGRMGTTWALATSLGTGLS